MTAMRCYDGHYGDAYPGDLDGRTWSFTHGKDGLGKTTVNDDASLIVGQQEGGPLYLMRTSKQPKYCQPFQSGTGSQRVLVLDANAVQSLYPIENNALPGYSYTRIGAGMLDAASLAGKQTAILNMLCDASGYFSKAQGDAIVQWVSAGHKLLIVDSDACGKSSYAFLPYAFTRSNHGANGASGDRLIVVEPDALGTTDKDDAAHFFDPQVFINHVFTGWKWRKDILTRLPHVVRRTGNGYVSQCYDGARSDWVSCTSSKLANRLSVQYRIANQQDSRAAVQRASFMTSSAFGARRTSADRRQDYRTRLRNAESGAAASLPSGLRLTAPTSRRGKPLCFSSSRPKST
jgi:hypothetical protein